ncbi:MAG: hypothetical protein K9K67_14735 [Bacteriovoracaceae bacterium]|nr:hypothetical protein [Bacteriovoracaceae bacterium]
MRLARALEDKKYDVRLRDKLVADKKLEAKDVETYLKSLDDDQNRFINTSEVEDRDN